MESKSRRIGEEESDGGRFWFQLSFFFLKFCKFPLVFAKFEVYFEVSDL